MRRVALLLFVSGLAGLVLEAVLVRQCAGWLGSSARATSLVLAAFLGGLALGSAAFGALADRRRNPLALYGLLEIGAGVCALGLVWLLGPKRQALIALASAWPGNAGRWVEAALAFALLLVPTALMGGSLPAVSRFLVQAPSRLLGAFGGLYAVNTLGGAAGVYLAGFELFERLGVPATGYLAGALEIAVGIAALVLARSAPARAGDRPTARPPTPSPRPAPRPAPGRVPAVCAAAAMLGGLAGLGYEVLWARVLPLMLRSYAYSFSLMLALFLLGIVLGSAIVARLGPRIRRSERWLGDVLVLGGLYVAFSVIWLPAILQPEPASGFGAFIARSALRASVVIIPPTLAAGMALPLALQGYARGRVGRDVGAVYALNTLGSIAGSLLAGFVLLPALGAPVALGVLAVVQAAAGALVHAASRRTARAAVAAGLAMLALLPGLRGNEPYVRAFIEASPGGDRAGELLFFHEGPTDTIAVVRKDYGFFDAGAKSLLTNGFAMSATVKPVWRYMAAEGHLPVLFARRPSSAAAVGVGTGITLSALVSHPRLERILALELSEGVAAALDVFAHENEGAHRDPRVELVVEDGRYALERSAERFDVITVEPPPPVVAGAVHLYALDFYELCKRRLRPGGVVAQWLPLHAQSLASARMTARTFLEAFPHAQLWMPSARDAVLIGSDAPLRMAWSDLAAAYAAPRTRRNLKRAYFEQPEALLACLLLDREAIGRWAGDAPVVTDAHPWMEFFRHQGRLMRDPDIATLLELPQADWSWVGGADPATLDAVRRENRALRLYLRAVASGRRGASPDAARLARATRFFLYPFGCAPEQLQTLHRLGPPDRLRAQEARCRALAGE